MDNKTENNCHFLKNTWVELYSRKILQGLLKGQPILGEDEPKFYTQQPHRWKIACWKNLQVLLFNNRLCTCWEPQKVKKSLIIIQFCMFLAIAKLEKRSFLLQYYQKLTIPPDSAVILPKANNSMLSKCFLRKWSFLKTEFSAYKIIHLHQILAPTDLES